MNVINVAMESVGLLDVIDQEHDILRIKIQVRNLAFEKKVHVHTTFDNWKTVEVREAKYKSTIKHFGFADIDRFYTDIDTDCDGESVCHLQFAIQYCVAGTEYWDNNNGKNYSVKVDRTVRIPAKEIKSHPFYEGPATRYKIKPGYHYPYSINENSGQLSAALPLKSSTGNQSKNTNDVTNLSIGDHEKPQINKEDPLKNSISDNKVKDNSNNDKKDKINNKDQNNCLNMKSNCKAEDENEKVLLNQTEGRQSEDQLILNEKDDEEEESSEEAPLSYFSWNEPISLRYSTDRSVSSLSSSSSVNYSAKGELTEEKNKMPINPSANEYPQEFNSDKLFPSSLNPLNTEKNSSVLPSPSQNKCSIPISSSFSSPSPSSLSSSVSSSYDSPQSSFSLPKQSWFKDAPHCVPNNTFTMNPYHHSNKLFGLKNNMNTLSKKGLNIDGCEKNTFYENSYSEDDIKNNQKYGSSIYSSSSSSKYMNNQYGQPTSYLYKDSKDNYTPNYTYGTLMNQEIYNSCSNDTYYENKYPTSHLYATQDDFSSDSILFF